MTIAISIKVGEGLVYAADSTSSFFDNTAGQSRLAQSFHHARKLIQLEDYPIGIMTFGLGSIGARNLESLVAEFENGLIPLAARPAGDVYTVEAIATDLKDFLAAKYDAEFPIPAPAPAPDGGAAPPDPRPQMGVIMGGYSRGQFFADEFVIGFPGGTVTRTRDNTAADVGALWWGVTTPIMRLVLGFDPDLHQWFLDQEVDPAEVGNILSELRGRMQWNILFDGMPLQDAIDFGVYLANVTIGHSRFVVGPPVCGGHVDVATITHRGFSWVRQKQNIVKGDSVFF